MPIKYYSAPDIKKQVDEIASSEVWDSFFGSAFNGHQAKDRCQSYPEDVRLLLLSIQPKRVFPVKELIPIQTPYAAWLA